MWCTWAAVVPARCCACAHAQRCCSGSHARNTRLRTHAHVPAAHALQPMVAICKGPKREGALSTCGDARACAGDARCSSSLPRSGPALMLLHAHESRMCCGPCHLYLCMQLEPCEPIMHAAGALCATAHGEHRCHCSCQLVKGGTRAQLLLQEHPYACKHILSHPTTLTSCAPPGGE